MALLTKEEEQKLRDFLKAIEALGSNVGFVTQAIQDVRERNERGTPAKESDLIALRKQVEAGTGGVTLAQVKNEIRNSKVVPQ